jgi:DNA repair protein RadC
LARSQWLREPRRGVIRSADQAVEELARDALHGDPQRNAQAGEVLYLFASSAPRGLAEPSLASFGSIAASPNFPARGNPIMMLAKADHNSLPGVDVLEALLYIADPKAKCRQVAEQALREFGSVGAVLSAPVLDLTTRLGIRDEFAYALKAIHAGMRSILREPIRERIRIGSFTELVDYVGLSLKHETIEVLRVLYLDCKNGLISDEETHRGTVDHVPIYPREMVKRALELGASAVILVHNHPSGDPTPSKADTIFSQEVQRALSVMNMTLHDSLIIGKNGFASLRSLKQL